MADEDPDPDAPGSLYDAMRKGGVDYRPWDGQGLGDDECFVCGTRLTAQNRTLEDVIPKWMQRELVVGHPQQPKLHLPNWTTFPLTKIKVPACRPCNGEQLSGVEQEISDAFRAGVEAVAELSERTLRIWFAKIAYGARRNDLRLRSDIRDPRSPSLASESDLHELSYLHWLLQEARDVVRVAPGHSTFVVLRSQTVGCNVCDFDIAVPIGWPTPVMLRYRDVTIMGAVDDRGSLEPTRSSSPFVAAQALELHPVQVRALWALLVRRALDLDSSAVPVRYAVADGRVWIDRSPTAPGLRAGAGGAARKDPLPSADTILSALIDEPLEVITAYGGAAGLIVEPDGAPLHIPFEHGVLRLSPR